MKIRDIVQTTVVCCIIDQGDMGMAKGVMESLNFTDRDCRAAFTPFQGVIDIRHCS